MYGPGLSVLELGLFGAVVLGYVAVVLRTAWRCWRR